MDFSEFHYKTAIHLASQISNEIYGINELYPSAFFELDDAGFQNKIIQPNRQTLLHEYIAFIHEDSLEYWIRKMGYAPIIDEVIDALNFYEVDYPKLNEDYNGSDDDDGLYEVIIQRYNTLTSQIANETFTILFNDKRLMRDFNQSISEIICKMKKDDFPELLKKDGVLYRCAYLPKWLKDGIFFRDKGRCQLCGKDLTHLLSSNNSIHYDHIIPLELGGSNDPTNFQILCEGCNTSKGARHCGTRNLVQVFWK